MAEAENLPEADKVPEPRVIPTPDRAITVTRVGGANALEAEDWRRLSHAEDMIEALPLIFSGNRGTQASRRDPASHSHAFCRRLQARPRSSRVGRAEALQLCDQRF